LAEALTAVTRDGYGLDLAIYFALLRNGGGDGSKPEIRALFESQTEASRVTISLPVDVMSGKAAVDLMPDR
jgi:hypothetical protein